MVFLQSMGEWFYVGHVVMWHADDTVSYEDRMPGDPVYRTHNPFPSYMESGHIIVCPD